MSKKRRNRTGAPAGPARKGKSSGRRRRRGSSGVNPLVWLGGVLAIIAVLVGINLLSGALAKPPTLSREDPAGLLPLAEAKWPLKGGHDMARIPQQTPAPQPAPEGATLPSLELPTTEHDFGRIPGRPDVAHVFAVQNTGTADLKIWNLVTSCGCTTAELSSSVIPSGQRADLTVTFDPDFHVTKGPVVRLVWFATNDPTQPWAEVRFTADVQ